MRPEHVRAAGERRRLLRLEDAAGRNPHFEQVVEAVVEQDLRVEQIDGERAEEHLEHLFVQQEVDRRRRLRIAAVEVEDRLVALAPQRAGDLVRAVAHAVVVDPVLELRAVRLPSGMIMRMIAAIARLLRSSISHIAEI